MKYRYIALTPMPGGLFRLLGAYATKAEIPAFEGRTVKIWDTKKMTLDKCLETCYNETLHNHL